MIKETDNLFPLSNAPLEHCGNLNKYILGCLLIWFIQTATSFHLINNQEMCTINQMMPCTQMGTT